MICSMILLTSSSFNEDNVASEFLGSLILYSKILDVYGVAPSPPKTPRRADTSGLGVFIIGENMRFRVILRVVLG